MISFRIDDCELISLKQERKLDISSDEKDDKDDPFDYSSHSVVA
jgi:hypothetical protein